MDALDKKVIKYLENEYKGTKFFIVRNKYLIELIYDNKDHIDDDNFCDEIFDKCMKFYENDDLCKLAVTYDFINRIPSREIDVVFETNLKVETIVPEKQSFKIFQTIKKSILKELEIDKNITIINDSLFLKKNSNRKIINTVEKNENWDFSYNRICDRAFA